MLQDSAIFVFMMVIALLFVGYGIKMCMILADVVRILFAYLMPAPPLRIIGKKDEKEEK